MMGSLDRVPPCRKDFFSLYKESVLISSVAVASKRFDNTLLSSSMNYLELPE